MRRLNKRTYAEQIQYHLDDGRAVIFDDNQPARVEKARELLRNIVGGRSGLRIVELGCGASDISGPFSEEGHLVFGTDVVPEAQRVSAERWPKMHFYLQPIESLQPMPCDVLVLCETLEHLYDPIAVMAAWGRKAGAMVIGHPLNEWPAVEPGHIWSYDESDFDDWFRIAGMEMREAYTFEMGSFPGMILGRGDRA